MNREYLKLLWSDTNKAIEAVASSGGTEGAVNWADLSCRRAAWVSTDSDDAYAEVLIRKASPEAAAFQEDVRIRLERAGWLKVSVVTAW